MQPTGRSFAGEPRLDQGALDGEVGLGIDAPLAELAGSPPNGASPRRLLSLAMLGALVAACRPRQWVKNVLVIAAPGAAGALGQA